MRIIKGVMDRDVKAFDVPKGAKLLHVHEENDLPTIWALVNTARPLETRYFELIPDGKPFTEVTPTRIDHPLVGEMKGYIGTVHVSTGTVHIFERLRKQ